MHARSNVRAAVLVLAAWVAVACDAGASMPDAGMPDAGMPEDGAMNPDAGVCILDEPFAAAPVVALPSDYDRDAITRAVEAALRATDHDVDRGVFDFFYVADCEGMPSCYGNNPASPYGLLMLPPAPGEVLAELGEASAALTRGDARAVFRLRADEVIALAIRTPPDAAYFGFTPYVFGRGDTTYFASLGDTLNQLVIATASAGGSRFGAETLLLLGADASQLELAREAWVAAGVPEGMINVVPLPTEDASASGLYAPGLSDDGDTLMVLFRVALFSDTDAGQAWLSDPGATVLRIRPQIVQPTAPLVAPALRPTGSRCTEAGLRPALDALESSLRARFSTATHAVRVASSIAAPLDGPDCLAGTALLGANCLGDNRDTHYVTGLATAPLEEGTDLYVIGVDHARSGKATYVSVAVMDSVTLAGTGSVSGDELVGSASRHGGDDSLFVVRVTRGACEPGEACLSVPSAGWPSIPLDHDIRIIVRPYLDPATAARPEPSELVLSRVVSVTERR